MKSIPALFLFRSGRVIAPAVLFLVFFFLVVQNLDTPLEGAALASPFIFLLGGAITVLILNADDAQHRDILVARIGSRARSHRSRAFQSMRLLSFVSAFVVVYSWAISQNRDLLPIAFALMLVLSASMLGLSLGLFLGRPVIDKQAIAVLVLPVSLIGLLRSPPIRSIFQHYNTGDGDLGPIAFAATFVIAAASVAISSQWADRKKN